MEIPECVHPLSRVWDQPKSKDIEIDNSHALMSEKQFNQLHEYSTSVPTGVYSGKMWKARIRNGKWYLRWYEDDSVNREVCNIKSRIIIVIK